MNNFMMLVELYELDLYHVDEDYCKASNIKY